MCETLDNIDDSQTQKEVQTHLRSAETFQQYSNKQDIMKGRMTSKAFLLRIRLRKKHEKIHMRLLEVRSGLGVYLFNYSINVY
jgi:hypothetical protein